MKYQDKLQHTTFVPRTDLLKPIIIGIIIIPISLFLWIFGVLRANFFASADSDSSSPIRWLIATAIPAFISYKGLRKQSLDLSGALLGYCVGFILTITSYAFLVSLMVFFISSSWATKFRSNQKEKLEENFKKGGQRNWIQVLCNGGVAAYLGVIYFIESGSGEFPIDFSYYYRRSWLSIAILISLASANGDSWASELGTVFTNAMPRLITSGKKVPHGTNGGVTLVGMIFSALGGLVVGLAYYVAIILRLDADTLSKSVPQWPLIFVGLFGGLFGSLVDSILGATCQFSGLDPKTKAIVKHPREGVLWISGMPRLDNNTVNLVSYFLTAIIGSWVAIALWPV